jgi:hypothetical protein
MTLTLTGHSKNGRAAFYSGARQPVRYSLALFPNKVAPETIPMEDGIFAPGKQPKVKLTPEERKAAAAAKPKLTLAEKIARAEEKLAAAKAKLAKEAAEAAQPSL